MTRTSLAARPASLLIRALALALLASLMALLPVALAPASPAQADDPEVPTTVSLAVDNNEFATNESSTLTATLDVALSGGESLSIYDVTNGSVIKTCTSGSDCSMAVSWSYGPQRSYQAFVGTGATNPAAGRLVSGLVDVKRRDWVVNLSADRTEFATGESATLTAIANQPANFSFSGSGWRLVIYDQGSGAEVASCLSGFTCEAIVRYNAGPPRTYLARAVPYTGTAEGDSIAITVSRKPWNIMLSADMPEFGTNTNVELTATANQEANYYNGSPGSGWMLVIQDQQSGATVGSCNTGLTCTAYVHFNDGSPRTYVARAVAYNGGGTEGASNPVTVSRKTWSVRLETDRTEFASDESATMTATANQPANYYSGSPGNGWALAIIDRTTGARVGSCNTGLTCTTTVHFNDGAPHVYAARVESYGGAIEGASNEIAVARKQWSVNLSIDRSRVATDESAVITATANQPSNLYYGSPGNGWGLLIKDLTTGANIGICNTGLTCTANASFTVGTPHDYVAYVVSYNGSTPEGFSNQVTLARKPWTVAVDNDGATVTATTNQPPLTYGPVYYSMQFIRSDNGAIVYPYSCPTATSCTTPARAGVNYLAIVSISGTTDLQATSDGFSADTGRGSVDPASLSGGGDPNSKIPQCKCADPVNTATGEFYENVTDLLQPGRTPLLWNRVYSTQHADQDGPLGYGWSAPFDMHIIEPTASDPSGTPTKVVNENGSETAFMRDAVNGSYSAAPNVQATLVHHADGTWTMTRDHDTHFRFGSAGRLTAVEDPNGEAMNLTRNGAGRVTSLNGTAGSINLIYGTSGNAENHIIEATAPGGRSVTYTYGSAGNLASVTDPRNKTTTYSYNADHQMVSMTSPRGVQTTNDYDNQGRVVEQTDPMGGATEFDYSNGTQTGTTQTRITDPAGRIVDYLYDNGWLAEKTVAPTSSAPRRWRTFHDAGGNPILTVDPLGRGTYATFNKSGERLSATDATGAQTSWVYNANGRVTHTYDANGNSSSTTYDANGNPTVIEAYLGSSQSTVTTLAYADASHPGDLTSVTDPRGGVTNFTYNAAGLQTSQTSPEGRKTSRTYDAAGRQQSVVTPRGNKPGADPDDFKSTYVYNASGLPTSITGPLGDAVTYGYDNDGNQISVTDAEGATTGNTLDLLDRLTKTTDPRGKEWLSHYDAAGLLLWSQDPEGAKTSYVYDDAGVMVASTSPYGNAPGATSAEQAGATMTYTVDLAGQVTQTSTPNPAGGAPITTQTAYDRAGRVYSSTDAEGGLRLWTYSSTGQVLRETSPVSGVTTYTYNRAGWPLTSTDPMGHVTTTSYDTLGHVIQVTDPLGNTASYGYDADGLLVSSIDPRGNVPGAAPGDFETAYDHDADGNVTGVTNPDGGLTQTTYDVLDRAIQTTDPTGRSTSYAYDGRGLLSTVTNPDGGAIDYSYDAAGNRTSVTDPLGHSASYTHDDANRLLTQTDALSRTSTMTYDPAGVLNSVTRARGTVAWGHDILSRTTGVDYSDSTPDVTYGLDRLGRRTSMTDGSGTQDYTYAPDGALASTSRGATSFSYNYDLARRLTSATGPNGALTYAYDNADRMTSMKRGTEAPTTYAYDADGSLTSTTQPNGVATARDFDGSGRLTDLTTAYADGASEQRSYALDAAGRPTSLDTTHTPAPGAPVTAPTAESRSWLYDPAGRVTAECPTANCTEPDADETWAYDTAGNITQSSQGDTVADYTYDAGNQVDTLTRTTGAEVPVVSEFGYDTDGNVVASETGAYTWDLAGRLVESASGGDETSYSYDGDGNRLSTTSETSTSTATTDYEWDLNGSMPMLATESTETSTAGSADARTVTADYTYGADGTPSGIYAQDSLGATSQFAVTDRLGSVVGLAGADGASAAAYDYTPYGQRRGPPAAGSAATSIETGSTSGSLGYTGQQTDASGLLYLRARYYDPALGTFLSSDPLGGSQDAMSGQSVYGYANSNPLAYTDPTGLYGIGDLASDAGDAGYAVYMGAGAAKEGIHDWTVEHPGLTRVVIYGVATVAGVVCTVGTLGACGPAAIAAIGAVAAGTDYLLTEPCDVTLGGFATAAVVGAATEFVGGKVFAKVAEKAAKVLPKVLGGSTTEFAGGGYRTLGSWESLDPVAGRALRQGYERSCVAACGSMLGGGSEDSIIAAMKMDPTQGADPADLAPVLSRVTGRPWTGGAIGQTERLPVMRGLMNTGQWGAELSSKTAGGQINGPRHMVVVDGYDDLGRIAIRDPQDGYSYSMSPESFVSAWTMKAVWSVG